MKKTIIGLATVSLLLGASGVALAAAGDKCKPHKPGHVLDATGKCVKAPS